MPIIDTEKLEAYAQQIYERENQFNTFTLKTIARRVKATGQLSAFDQEALKKIADISGDMKNITKELSRITKMNIEDIEKIYAQVINDGVNSYKPLYDFKNMEFKPITQNDYAMKLVRHFAEVSAEQMINLSNTKAIGFTDTKGHFTSLEGAFQKTIDDAVIAVSNGTTDFNFAMAKTIEQLGGSGVVVNYGSGVTRSLNAMVRQNLLWGAKKAAQSYDDYVSDELGLDGFEVDAHSGCRKSHRFMQGKMYSYKGDKVIKGVKYEDGAEALERLKDYGCLHFKTGVLLGVSEPRYSQEELDRIHKETTEKIEYNGKEKTLYEWKQTQRRLEREYRKAQTQSATFKESGNNIKARNFKDKADAIKSTYDDLAAKVPGLYDHSERMRTYFNSKKTLTNDGSGGIIKEKEYMRAQFPKGTQDITNPGDLISSEKLIALESKAKEYGIKFDTQIGKFGGFENYRGDPSVLDDVFERIYINKKELTKPIKNDTVLLRYKDVIDDSGAIDINAFAQVNGRTITLNRFMYDDTEYLKKEYLSAVQKGIFTRGTDYRNVIDHEMGHIFNKTDRGLLPRTINIIEREAKKSNITVREFIEKNISKYAWHSEEIIAEINAMRKGTVPGVSKTIWKEITSR